MTLVGFRPALTNEERRINRMAAAILARIIRPDRADWPAQVAGELLRLLLADEDLERFRRLLAGHYVDTLTADEEDERESDLFVECMVAYMRE